MWRQRQLSISLRQVKAPDSISSGPLNRQRKGSEEEVAHNFDNSRHFLLGLLEGIIS